VAARVRCESGGECERAGERGEEVQRWPGVLRGLYKGEGGPGRLQWVVTGGG
jgi:hypothetical protein